MASKFVLWIPFLLLLLQTFPLTLQYSIPMGPRPEYHLTFQPSENYAEIDVKKIGKALWDAGYKIMSLVLERRLSNIIPYACGSRFGFDGQETVKIFNNNTITIFAPPDEAFRFENWIVLDYQFVTSKVDKQSFDLGSISEDSRLLTCDLHWDVIVSEVPHHKGTYPSINNVKITKWDIYNDGHILVHGVENFFNPRDFFDKVDGPSRVRVTEDVAVI